MPDKRPHIVIFNPDQWRGDVLGHMGNPAAVTPNLDRVAETDGVSFRNAFCQNPVCTPSRCSFMSGWYPHTRGHRSMGRMLRLPDETNLLKVLKDSGYFVWWGGKNDLVPGQHGFEDHCDVKYASSYWKINDPDVEPPLPLYWGDHASEWRGDPDGDRFYSFYVGKIPVPEGAPYYRDWDWACVEGAIRQIHNRPTDRPLCIFLALAYPHPPYGVEDPWFGMIDRDRLPARIAAPESWGDKCTFLKAYHDRLRMAGWSEDRWTELRAVYYGMCARVDHQFGLIMEALREAGIYDETAVFMFPDHGDYTGDYGVVEKHQNCFEDCLTRVPLVLKPPAGVPVRPRISDAMVELVDFPATVEALTGAAMPHVHFGRSLLPVVAGETDEHRDAVFCEGGRLEAETWFGRSESGGKAPSKGGLYWAKQSLQEQGAVFLGKSAMVRTREHKYVHRLYERDELYDLTTDPRELRNVVDDLAYAAVLTALQCRMLRWHMETGDVTPADLDRRE